MTSLAAPHRTATADAHRDLNPDLNRDRDLVAALQALAEETRLDLVRCLAGGERCVCELQDDLDASQSRLSFHLKKLKDAGIVADRRDGRWVYYRLVPGVLEAVGQVLGQLEPSLTSGDEAPSASPNPRCC